MTGLAVHDNNFKKNNANTRFTIPTNIYLYHQQHILEL